MAAGCLQDIPGVGVESQGEGLSVSAKTLQPGGRRVPLQQKGKAGPKVGRKPGKCSSESQRNREFKEWVPGQFDDEAGAGVGGWPFNKWC